MDQSPRQKIESFYKQGSVFERDEAYYTQILSGNQRTAANLQGVSRQSTLLNSRSNAGLIQTPRQRLLHSPSTPIRQSPYYQQSTSAAYQQALEENRSLSREINQLLNGSNKIVNSISPASLQQYERTRQEATILQQQQEKIWRLQQRADNNEAEINTLKKYAEELQTRMANIKSIDRNIYSTLQSSINRPQQLLDQAVTALSQGKSREEISKILTDILP